MSSFHSPVTAATSVEAMPKTAISFAAFEAKARAAGFDEVLERRWPPDTAIATIRTVSMWTRW